LLYEPTWRAGINWDKATMRKYKLKKYLNCSNKRIGKNEINEYFWFLITLAGSDDTVVTVDTP
jgi:hypothetical protein